MPGAGDRERLKYGLALGVLFAFLQWAPLFGFLASAVLVAVCATRGQTRRTAGVFGVAIIAGWISLRAPEGALVGLVAGAPGLPIAFGLRRRWSYGKIVGVVTALSCAAGMGIMAGQWEETAEWARKSHDELTVLLEGPDAGEFEEKGLLPVLEMQRWIFAHWAEVLPGFSFALILMGACVVMALTARWLRPAGDIPALKGSFRAMRPPEWLVWAVIVAALLWFADQQWPSDAMRIASWNGIAALATVYWLNGLAVVMYGLVLFRPHPMMMVAIVFAMVFLNVQSLLPMVGLFDTWGEFRRKMDALLAARKTRENSHDDTV